MLFAWSFGYISLPPDTSVWSHDVFRNPSWAPSATAVTRPLKPATGVPRGPATKTEYGSVRVLCSSGGPHTARPRASKRTRSPGQASMTASGALFEHAAPSPVAVSRLRKWSSKTTSAILTHAGSCSTSSLPGRSSPRGGTTSALVQVPSDLQDSGLQAVHAMEQSPLLPPPTSHCSGGVTAPSPQTGAGSDLHPNTSSVRRLTAESSLLVVWPAMIRASMGSFVYTSSSLRNEPNGRPGKSSLVA